jgi:hypothetical protein
MLRWRSVCAAVLASSLCACGTAPGHRDKSSGAAHPSSAVKTTGAITVTTGQGKTLEFDHFHVTCPKNTMDEWGKDADVVDAVSGLEDALPKDGREPSLRLTAGDDLADGSRITLPQSEEWGHAKTFVTAFVTRAGTTRELSSGAEESSGAITVVSASCTPRPHLDVRIDGTLWSEMNGGGRALVHGHVQVG